MITLGPEAAVSIATAGKCTFICGNHSNQNLPLQSSKRITCFLAYVALDDTLDSNPITLYLRKNQFSQFFGVSILITAL